MYLNNSNHPKKKQEGHSLASDFFNRAIYLNEPNCPAALLPAGQRKTNRLE
ncbi:hypothetical protein SD78_2241 [Bacillus badius]|nr:hypothetical protein SD78_2241 [Bacillus badius]